MSLIRFKKVSKVYKKSASSVATLALENIDLSILPGEFIAIAGPSGSGKTTLLNLMGALDKPSKGEVYFEDSPLSKLNTNRLADLRLKKIGFIFQSSNLFHTLTALENTEYVAQLKGIPPQERRNQATETLIALGLGEHLHKMPHQLSGSQQQKVATARAMMVHPPLILADEPTANLDSKTGEDLIKIMRTFNRNLNITFVFSTHDKMVAEQADRIIKLHDGRIEK